MVHAIAQPGDYVICLGAGNITQWAGGAAGRSSQRLAGRQRRRGERRDDGRSTPRRLRRLPPLRGRGCSATRRWAPSTWFRVGGPAEALVRAGGRRRSRARSCAALPLDVPVRGDRRRPRT
jgi:hypothetical protein